MATFNMLITYPDGEGARIVAALRAHYTVDGVVPTQAQAIEAFRQSTLRTLRDVVLRLESDAAHTAVTVVPVNPT